MRCINYPGLNLHMEDHDQINRKVIDFQRDLSPDQDADFVRLRAMPSDLKVASFLPPQPKPCKEQNNPHTPEGE